MSRVLNASRTQPAGLHGLAALVFDGPRLRGVACATAGRPDDWYGGADRNGTQSGDQSRHKIEYRLAVTRARQVCARCPVIAGCLDAALDRSEPDGVWGGLDRPERLSAHNPDRYHSTRALAAALAELDHYGADVTALNDVIARHREMA